MKAYKTCDVTKKHIDRGNPGMADSCAIACALKDSENSDSKVSYSVNGSTITTWVEKDDSITGFDADRLYDIKVHPDDKNEVEIFIEDFDRRDENDDYIKDVDVAMAVKKVIYQVLTDRNIPVLKVDMSENKIFARWRELVRA